MSRFGYSDDDADQWQIIRWRGAVKAASDGKRGQQFFRDLLAALDALPEKKLIAHELEAADGCVCALGALGKARDLPMANIDPEDSYIVANRFGIARALACEVVFENDEAGSWREAPEGRFRRVRRWVESQIKPPQVPA